MHSERPMKTLLLWTQWWKNYHVPVLAESWGIGQFFNWTDQIYLNLRDFGCDHESFRCAITSNRSV